MDRTSYRTEVELGERFAFGRNWAAFLAVLDDNRIHSAEQSLRTMLAAPNLEGSRFLDIGSGSGLFSLAARRLGASVCSFDVDADSVQCTRELRRRYFPNDKDWVVEQASVLDEKYLAALGTFDVVYSWGVLHHTGAMWKALQNVASLVSEQGSLYIAIYNDQGRASEAWLRVKQTYNRLPVYLRWTILFPAFLRLWGPTTIRDFFRRQPNRTWKQYGKGVRGMSPWRDVVDWVGGLPFEVAKPEEVFAFYAERGFELRRLKTCAGGHGCNEFVFFKRPT